MSWLDGITDSMDMSLSKLGEIVWTGEPGVLQSMGSQRIRCDLVTEEQQQNSEVAVLAPDVMVFGDRVFVRPLGLEEDMKG